MIESIEFTNFKALRRCTLPLAPFTLLLGPNGSGKSSVLQALRGIGAINNRQCPQDHQLSWKSIVSITEEIGMNPVKIQVSLSIEGQSLISTNSWVPGVPQPRTKYDWSLGSPIEENVLKRAKQWLAQIQIYSLNADAIAQSVPVGSTPLLSNGHGLAAVLDDLKDNHLERWEALLAEMREWLPEYDYILFDKPQEGQKSVALRTKTGEHRIPAKELSQGTLVALALLTLAYLPEPPSLIGLEEIDRGLHPRLLRHLQDALYRLSYPESCGENRPPIQVIATTHSPYLLDLYRDHPEEVVLAQKEGLEVTFQRLSEIEHFDEILGNSPLSDVWYSGVLGGVTVKP